MILAMWAAVSLAEPTAWTVDPAAPPFAAPAQGKLGGKDPRDAQDRPYDAYVLQAPPDVWVEVTVTEAAFLPRLRVGDQEREFALPPPSVLRGWSAGGRVPVEIGSADGVSGAYAVSVAFVAPRTSEPPAVDALPPYGQIEPGSWHDGGWFCDLVSARFPDARAYTVSAGSEDAARLRVLVGRWEGGALKVEQDAVPAEGQRRPEPLEIHFAADVPRVFGVCRDGLGRADLTVRTPGDDVAPGTLVDPSRHAATLDEAAAAEQAALEKRMSTVTTESGEANRFDPFVVPLFLQSGLAYEAVVLTEADDVVPYARLYLAWCDATCEAFAKAAGMPLTRDGSWYVLDLPDTTEPQAWNPVHTERWRFTWPVGTSLTANLQVKVGDVGARKVRVVVGEE